MIGLGWRNKSFGKAAEIQEDGKIKIIEAGDGKNTSHGARVNALVTRIGNHSMQKGLPRSWIYADIEVYTYARGPIGLESDRGQMEYRNIQIRELE